MTEGRFTGIYFEGSGSSLTGRYFENGKAANIGIVLYQGDFYCTTTDGWLVKGVKTISQSRTNGLVPAGTYTFGDDYKMVDTTVKNGVYGGFYYENNEIVKGKGIVEFENNLYFVKQNGAVYTTHHLMVPEAKTNGLIPAGMYYFAADGKIIFEE